MAERDQSDAPFVPPEVPAELRDVYRAAYLAAYAETGQRLAVAQDPIDDESEGEDSHEPGDALERVSNEPAATGFSDRLKTNLAVTSAGEAGLKPARDQRVETRRPDPIPGPWSSFRSSPWFVPLIWAIAAVLLVLLAYIAGRGLASSLS